ncbi:Facilitated trehalose transporter Tret1 [Eumeta japonica]|uniref:Facilitated trehalose transporter Tret1 n=1 Tax=Eumeta variegata TaxID=151549 RepID=A0A4C1SS82_EUMVA|nr:Facilitated trehalose transporter Tret1 [Eumeta japonica]
MVASLSPISIGEYTSAKNRGAFLATTYVFVAAGMLVPSLDNFITLQQIAIICSVIAFIDLLIVYNSPESPSFLADKGRSRECRAVFRWLRGNEDNEELEKMIVSTQEVVERQSSNIEIGGFYKNFNVIVRKSYFLKPIILMITIYIMNQRTNDGYSDEQVIQFESHRLKIILAILRIIANILFIFIIKTVNRRTILFTAGCLNIVALLMKSLCVYARFDFDQPFVVTFFFYVHMFIKSIGIYPMTFTLAGEVFPLRYRSLASGISTLFLYPNISQLLHDAVGGWGAYVLQAGVVALCLGVAALLLPETKDRTLQDIEDEFRGRPFSPEEIHLSSRS